MVSVVPYFIVVAILLILVPAIIAAIYGPLSIKLDQVFKDASIRIERGEIHTAYDANSADWAEGVVYEYIFHVSNSRPYNEVFFDLAMYDKTGNVVGTGIARERLSVPARREVTAGVICHGVPVKAIVKVNGAY